MNKSALVVLALLISAGLILSCGARVATETETVPARTESFERFILSADVPGYAVEAYMLTGAQEGPATVVLAGAHGDEPAGVYALRRFLEEYRIRKGTLVVVPLQNPVAFTAGRRVSLAGELNNYSNFARAYPASTPSELRDRLILEGLSSAGSPWWQPGDNDLSGPAGPISASDRAAADVETALDANGYRRALDPDIRAAGERIFELFLGRFPDGTERYEQAEYVVDLHESRYTYVNSLCVDTPEGEAYVGAFLPEYNALVALEGLPELRMILDPIPTSLPFAASFELPRRAITITVETDVQDAAEDRIRQQFLTLRYLLERFGNEPYPVEEGSPENAPNDDVASSDAAAAAAAAFAEPLPSEVLLEGFRHTWQTWNNCGPASLSVLLSYWGSEVGQAEVALLTKPVRDDKNVSPDELEAAARELGFSTRLVSGFDTDRVRLLLAAGVPMLCPTWMIRDANDEFAHYRLLKGYSDAERRFFVEDVYLGPTSSVDYDEFDALWSSYGRLALFVFPAERTLEVDTLLGPFTDFRLGLRTALTENSADVNRALASDRAAVGRSRFALACVLTRLQRYDEASAEFDRAFAAGVPFRLTWYFQEPLRAWFAVGRYADTARLALETASIGVQVEEAWYWLGRARRELGDEAGAREALETALLYRPGYGPAMEALEGMGE